MRMYVLTGLLAVASVAMAGATFQTRPADAKVVELTHVRGNLYLMTGGGGNTAVFVTELGVVIVDTKLAGWGQAMVDKIKTITKRPITTIINTDSHSDHTGGNEFFPTSVEIVAHENTRVHMERMDAFAAKPNALPKLTFKEKTSLGAGKDRVDVLYFGAGHTNGDVWVVFPALRAAHAGDMFAAKGLPVIDAKNGGSGLAYPETLRKASAALVNVDTIITGQGRLVKLQDLEEYTHFNKEFRDQVVAGFSHGLSIDEVADAWTLAEKYRNYIVDRDRVRANVSAMFGELTTP
jgi:cyclase